MVKSKRNGFIRPITGDTDYLYDAFISYADQDCDFVHNQLLKNIEADGNLKCCIHKRDFVPGNDIATNITSAIHNSRKAVVIMSHNFLDSYWCSFEYNTARMESVYSRKKENMIIMVFIEQMAAKDLPLNTLMMSTEMLCSGINWWKAYHLRQYELNKVILELYLNVSLLTMKLVRFFPRDHCRSN